MGTVWAGTRIGGLMRVIGNQAIPLPAESGLPNLPVYNMVEGNQNHLLLGTSRGIIRVSTSQLNDVANGKIHRVSAALFGKLDGMPSSDCSGPSRPSSTRLADGTMFFATNKGFVHTTAFTDSASLAPPVARILGWSFGTDASAEGLQQGCSESRRT
jgi:hypothetical protein